MNEIYLAYVAEQCFKASSQSVLHQTLHHVQRQWENDGGVLLGSDGVESLQVAKLQGARRLGDYQRGLFQSAGRIHLALGCDHLSRRETNEGGESKRAPMQLW